MRSIHFALGLALGATACVCSSAIAQSETTKKRLRPAEDADREPQLEVRFRPGRRALSVGQPLRFSARGNRPFYVYAIARVRGEEPILLSTLDSGPIPPERIVNLPRGDASFRPERPGEVELELIASTQLVRVDRSRYRGLGPHLVLGDDGVAWLLKTLRMLEERRPGGGLVTKTLKVRLRRQRSASPRPAPQAPADRAARPVVMVRTDSRRYRAGDPGRLVFASTESGSIRLALRNPDGTTTPLTDQPRPVEANRVYTLEFTAVAPFGRQAVVAEFVATESSPKGMRLGTDESRPDLARDVFSFEVGERGSR